MILRKLFCMLLFCTFNVNYGMFLEENSIIYGISKIASTGNNLCGSEFMLFKNALDSMEPWAVKILDANGSPSYGFIYGNNMWLGSPFQCRDIQNRKRFELNHRKTENRINTECDFPPFPLAYAKIHMKHNSSLQINTNMLLNKYIQLGLCLPKSCENYYIQELLENYFANSKNFPFRQLYNSSLSILNVKVLREDTSWIFYEFKTIALIAISVPCVLFVILATFIDILCFKDASQVVNNQGKLTRKDKYNTRHEPSKYSIMPRRLNQASPIIQCFSLKKNLHSILNISLSKNSLPALHGLRFFGMIWIINVHSIFYGVDYFANVPQGFRLGELFLFQIYSNSSYCVDTFFFISGFLLAYIFYMQNYDTMFFPKNCRLATKVMEYFVLYANRCLRLMVPYVITILLTDVLFTYFRSTSALHSSECPDVTCSKFFWRNILFINNLYPRSEMCMSWSWYLSIDSQFFLIATFLLILSTMYFKLAVWLLFLLLFGVMIVTGVVAYNISYIPTMDDQLRELDAIYDLPWNRMGPYLIGIIFGYILVRLKGQLQLSNCRLILCWIVFPSVNLWIIFGIYGRQISEKLSALYMGISRTFWGLGVGWILVACSTNNGGMINSILCYQAWIPLSKLTYCAYLLNPLVANTLYLHSDTPFHLTAAQTVFSVSGVTIITFALAFVFCLFFEMPMASLTKLLLERVRKSERKIS